MDTFEDVIDFIKSNGNEASRVGMARYGINVRNAYGVSVTTLRGIAKSNKNRHDLALRLWQTGIHEARILATLVAEPSRMTPEQMEAWAGDLDSWDLCDQACNNLFRKTEFALEKCLKWTSDDREFVKRAGFALMACLAVHQKYISTELFQSFLQSIKIASIDDRNFVKKAVNWALRQLGKKNMAFHEMCLQAAEEMRFYESKSARWIAVNALRELNSPAVKQKLFERD